MIAVIYGPDAATAETRLTALLRELDPTGEATTSLDGRVCPLTEMINAVASVGLLTPRRVVVVRDVLSRAVKPAKGTGVETEPPADRPSAIDLARLFAAVPVANSLILIDSGITALPASVRKVLPSTATVIAAEPPRGQALIDWLCQTATAADAQLDPRTARLLAERCYPRTWSAKPKNPLYDRPPDIELLDNEIAKLALAAYPAAITRQHIETLVAAGDEDRLFPFVEATTAGRLAAALQELSALQERGDELHRVAAQVFQQIELAAILDTAESRIAPAAVGQAIGLVNPKRMAALAAGRRGQRGGTMRDDLLAAMEVDRRTKNGRLRGPDDALYELSAVFAAARPPGRAAKRGG